MNAVKPIYFILHNDQFKWYQENWEIFVMKEGEVEQAEIKEVIEYISGRIAELSEYLKRTAITKRMMKELSFFIEYAGILRNAGKETFKNPYSMQCVFMYNELLLGSAGYLTILNEIKNLENKGEAGSPGN